MKLKLNEKRLYPTDLVKYIGAKIDSKLNWKIWLIKCCTIQRNNFMRSTN